MRFGSVATLVVLLALALRAVTLPLWNLLDPSEGRYATIAQHMVRSGDWVTPHIYARGELIPFLGKPPLHTWITAISLSLLGSTELAARLPSLIAALVVCGLVFVAGRELFSARVASLSLLVLLSSLLFFFISGFCLTDPLLVLGTTALGTGFVLCARKDDTPSRMYGYLFFLGLAVGILTKGPVAVAVGVVAILPWLLLTGRWSSLRKLPWVGGVALLLILVVPWYVFAELRNPGLLRYFFINENLKRFLVTDYGDRYGSAHTKPYGMIWLMMAGAFVPWVFAWCAPIYRKFRFREPVGDGSVWFSYVVLWGLSAGVLFTFARQTSFYYVLPSLPWLALATGVILDRLLREGKEDISRFCRYVDSSGIGLCAISGGYLALKGEYIGLVGIIVLLLVARAYWRYAANESANPEDRPARSALVMVVTCVCVMVASRSHVARELSAKGVTSVLEDGTTAGPVAFFEKVPQSAYFYSEAINLSRGAGEHTASRFVTHTKAAPGLMQWLVVPTAKLGIVEPTFLSHFVGEKSVGRWSILKSVKERALPLSTDDSSLATQDSQWDGGRDDS